jgi:hypothetical protein
MTAVPGAGVGLGLVLGRAEADRLASFWARLSGYKQAATFGGYAMLMPVTDRVGDSGCRPCRSRSGTSTPTG